VKQSKFMPSQGCRLVTRVLARDPAFRLEISTAGLEVRFLR